VGIDIRLATWNIHGCVGTDRRYDPPRVAGIITELAADVVALQEVDDRRPECGGKAVLDFLAAETGMTPVGGPNLRDEEGEYGNALLTSLPIERVRRIDLSAPGREPRGAIEADLATPGGPLRVVATHLGLARAERRRQRAWLAREIADAHSEGEPIVLMADLNEWLPLISHARPDLPFDVAYGAPSFHSRLPLLRLDWILADPAPREGRAWAHRSRASRRASDHLPVIAELRWARDA
jgi:endonuclease/exonuclease/phosphatase family metal-dependent hydrolase